jgi:hypothetical protein
MNTTQSMALPTAKTNAKGYIGIFRTEVAYLLCNILMAYDVLRQETNMKMLKLKAYTAIYMIA